METIATRCGREAPVPASYRANCELVGVAFRRSLEMVGHSLQNVACRVAHNLP
jgi:hypothetical protein